MMSRCIEAPRKLLADGSYTFTRVITNDFFTSIPSKKDQRCLRLATVKGLLECRYMMGDGLLDDAKDVLHQNNSRVLKTFATGRSLGWMVEKRMVPDTSKEATTSLSKVVYTLWVRLVLALLRSSDASTAWIKPRPINFFEQYAQHWKAQKWEFNIINRLKHDRRIRENGQNCEDDKPRIQYRKCSASFNSIYFSAASSFEKYARKHAATIIPAGSALIWPGLSLRHKLGRSVAAWSMSDRNLRSTFARWIFNNTEQCARSDIDNTVCANPGSNPSQIVAVIPWLGGDYNPW